MNCDEFKENCDAYVEGTLPPAAADDCAAHVKACTLCRNELNDLKRLRDRVHAMNRAVVPTRDLWPAIEAQLASSVAENKTQRPRAAPPPRSAWRLIAGAALLAASIAVVCLVVVRQPPQRPAGAWSVSSVSGAPQLGQQPLPGSGLLRQGDWLETDGQSRAKVTVGAIGEVVVEPNSRLRLVATAPTDHRLELARGTLSALIWAPPRLFFVDTPSATAVDLGCAYTLTVDEKKHGILHVTLGYVALEHGDRQSIVPSGMKCVTVPGQGPGTPFAEDASDLFTAALQRIDFGSGELDALRDILAAASEKDAVTLWHLLKRARPDRRGEIYDKLAALKAPPSSVTRVGTLQGDKTMLATWASAVGIPEYLLK